MDIGLPILFVYGLGAWVWGALVEWQDWDTNIKLAYIFLWPLVLLFYALKILATIPKLFKHILGG